MISKYFYLIFLFSLLNFQCFGDDSLYGNDWKHVTRKGGINIYSKKMKGIPVKSLKAIGIIDAKIDNVVTILRDVRSASKWLPGLIERSYVENISDSEAILYDVNEMPWPVKNRDVVVHHKLELSEDYKSLILKFKSVTSGKKRVNSRNVRARFHIGEIKFTPTTNNKTRLELTLLVDPMGNIPKWVVNILQISMPYDFLEALNKFASKTEITPLPGIQKLLNQLIE
jgi:hypothetical protein